MAVINSISLGKGRGKLGNIVLQRYAGKTIARSKNSSISVPPTQLQLDQRVRFDNVRIAWLQWQSHYNQLQGLSLKWRKDQNVFYKLFTDSFPAVPLTTTNELFVATSHKGYGFGNLCEIVAANFAQQGLDIEVISQKIDTIDYITVNLMLRSYSAGTTYIHKHIIDWEEYLSGFIFVPIPTGFWHVFSVYLSANSGRLTSNIRT